MKISVLGTHVALIEDVAADQHEVQRKMGRCLLRLQQYERLLKALVSSRDIAGPGNKLAAIRESKAQELANKTLGHMVGILTGSHLAVEGSSAEMADADEPASVPDAGWFRMRSFITMTPEAHAQTVLELRELVALRNDIVHHLIEKFEVWTVDGCRAAAAYLDDSYLKIDRHHASLMAWAKSTVEGSALLASFLTSQAFEDFLDQHVAPGATMDWSAAQVVGLLREAEHAHRHDGWTRLSDAIAFINTKDREQAPKRYGCASWLQLLKRSELFDVRRERAEAATARATSYRSREAGGR